MQTSIFLRKNTVFGTEFLSEKMSLSSMQFNLFTLHPTPTPPRQNNLTVMLSFKWFFLRGHCKHLLVQTQQEEHKKKVWNMFKVNNKGINDIIMVSLLLNLNMFYIFLQCFYHWLWIGKCFPSPHLLFKVHNRNS